MKNQSEADRQRFFSQHGAKLFVLQAVAFVVIGILIGSLFWLMASRLWQSSAESTALKTSAAAGSTVAKETLWTCAMHPQIRRTKPGQCPICGMDLIPVVKTAGGLRTLPVSPEAKALMRIETTPVERRYVTHTIPMVGKVNYDETRLKYIAAWVPGRLDKLYVDFTGVYVNKGDHMVYIYSPELYATQEELIQALKYRQEGGQTSRYTSTIDLVASAREKLRLLGLKESQIAEIEKQSQPSDHLTIYSPVSGIVTEKLKQEGDYVKTGERIYTVADLNQVWVNLDAYESDLTWIRYGQKVTITTDAYPGEKFQGRISFIQPVLNDKTRTVKVRVNVPNEDGKLKPDMFVHATVQPRIAAGGRVMDADLAGKWICPMHPDVVKDTPGKCDICGMPLVRTESLGYVTPATDEAKPPLVIPSLAALITGTRAVVYVELPEMPSFAEPAFQTLSVVVQEGVLSKIRQAFATYARMLDRPYDRPGTDHARRQWHTYADQLARDALAGQRATSAHEAKEAFSKLKTTMDRAREEFAPESNPTFEGREIVLGPRAGDYYLVRNGLEEGELVVTQGNFKLDSEIQIQAKPSMMTPEGGGGGGHMHGEQASGAAQQQGDDQHQQHAGRTMTLPASFREQIRELVAAYDGLTKDVSSKDLAKIKEGFSRFGEVLSSVDASTLHKHARMQWKEFAMLLSNDAVEGKEVEHLSEADRVFLLLKGHMRRMREQLELSGESTQQVASVAVGAEFQAELAKLWQAYLPLQQALAADKFSEARRLLGGLSSALQSIDDKALTGDASSVWQKERANVAKLITALQAAADLNAMRAEFGPLSDEIGVLAKTFGFGPSLPIYELHCPMAFEGRGAVWYQDSDQVQNPYFGPAMLKCADRVELISDGISSNAK